MPNPVPLTFPLGGINENGAYADAPGRFVVSADHVLNVRPHDALERRARGGQRTGISKYFSSQVNGNVPVQGLGSLVQAFDPAVVVPDKTLVDVDFTSFSNTGRLSTLAPNWTDGEGSTKDSAYPVSIPASTYYPAVTDVDGVRSLHHVDETSSDRTAVFAIYNASIIPGDAYVIRVKARFAYPPSNGEHVFSILFRYNKQAGSSADTYYWLFSGTTPSGRLFCSLGSDQGFVGGAQGNYDLTAPDSGNYTDPITIEVRVSGNNVSLWIEGNQIVAPTQIANYTTNTGFALGLFDRSSSAHDVLVEQFSILTGVTPASLRTTKIVAVSGGSIYLGTRAAGLQLATSGSSAVRPSGPVAMQSAFQKVFFCDGRAGNYVYYDASDNTVKDWASDVSAGALPAGTADSTIGCRIITLYRGRIVMAGLQEEPQNWFMSKAGDPFDWDYSPATTTATQAVAGNTSNAGELGDIVTALVPYQDDVMIMGGDHTLSVMRGDPAAGGQIDMISRQTGIVGQYAWAFDQRGVLYFLGPSGLFRFAPQAVAPDLISQGRLDRFFANINFATRVVRLVYDRKWQGVHIFLNPVNEPDDPVDHIFWDERTDSFWRDQYPVAIGPTAVHLYDADDPDDRAVLMGGWDGYLRFFDDSVTRDDGQAIDSFVRFPILHPSLPMGQFQMSDLQITLAAGGDVAPQAARKATLSIFRGNTPQAAALATTPVFAKELHAGPNPPIRKRIRGNAIQMQLRNNTSGQVWAYEAGAVLLTGVGRLRRKDSN